MSKFIDITGRKYGRLTVIKLKEKRKNVYYWICKCECGNEKIVSSSNLKNGNVRSCGCLKSETSKINHTTHGLHGSRLYKIWKSMKQRCFNKNTEYYKYYGGRGIKICKEWNNFKNFYTWATHKGYSDNLTIDRINVNGNYEPANCRWVDTKTQANNRRNNIKIDYLGQTHNLQEWCDILKIPYKRTHLRLTRLKWNIEQAFTLKKQVNQYHIY